ncbi:glycosyl hydrolase [Microbacterium sp. 1P10UB]|uniref:glycosyl hydrolase n=1 Tax=unclassified Microbacterium TaxID=2609290 RepID=UPI0039A16CC5
MTPLDDATPHSSPDAPPSAPATSALWNAFTRPPDEARPRVWWHWMDGNIDPAGIVRDLTWLHGVGVRGVQMFDGGMGMPLVVPEAVRPGSAAWTDAVDTAVRTAGDLGLELAVATSSGWSAAGGPWVRPEDAMKKVVWSETVVDGGGRVQTRLADLPSVPGLYQDTPRWGAPASPGFAVDWVVLAIPDHDGLHALSPGAVRASGPVERPEVLTDGSFADALSIPRDPDAWSEGWLEQTFDVPVTVRSVVVGLPGPRGFGAAPPPEAVLESSNDGDAWHEVARLDVTTVPARTASFAPVTARRFRLRLSGASAAEALPPLEDGVRMPPVLRRADAFLVSQFALFPATRVHHAEVKAGFGVVDDYYAVDTDTTSPLGIVEARDIVDVTAHVRDGVLDWPAPAGRWRVVRLGASLTGQTNGPAPADSTGLEVDKLDGRRVADYLRGHLSRLGDERATSRFDALLSDSIESGSQNWTDRIEEEFAARRQYDARPWLPVLAGFVVASPEESDAFLFDWRRTIAELLAREYYGTLGSEARRRGMRYYAEALEDRRPQLGDDLAMRAQADVPMGAMWTFDPDGSPRPTYVADLKGAASVSHVYGKDGTGSEAFTSFGRPWSWSPKALKHIADLQLTLGVTRFCIHTSPHQPIAAPPPGIALAPFLGQAFTVNETWSAFAGPWIDYLARCSTLLSAGRPDVDVAVFVGEEAPVTGLFGEEADTSVPAGFDHDYVGPDALRDILRVEGGRIVADGADYAVLFLGGSSAQMTCAALAEIERLVDAGAAVIGDRPTRSPSLADDPAEFSALCDRLWGVGRVIPGSLPDGLRRLGLTPEWVVTGGAVRRISRVVDGRRLLFAANPAASALDLRVRLESGAPLAVWDPVEVRAMSCAVADDGEVTLTLPPFGSVFVLEQEEPVAMMEPDADVVDLDGEWALELPGAEPTTMSPAPLPWTDAAGRGFSGTAVYQHLFTVDPAAVSRTAAIELTDVGDIARIVLNGADCGVAWTAPFRVDVSNAIRAGENELAVHVTNPWRNRLIAEGAQASGEVFAPMTGVFEPTAAVEPAGLLGAVRLRLSTPHPAPAAQGSAGR